MPIRLREVRIKLIHCFKLIILLFRLKTLFTDLIGLIQSPYQFASSNRHHLYIAHSYYKYCLIRPGSKQTQPVHYKGFRSARRFVPFWDFSKFSFKISYLPNMRFSELRDYFVFTKKGSYKSFLKSKFISGRNPKVLKNNNK